MNEKSLKVLEQYELDVKHVRRGRDCYLADTDKGMILLREYNGSNQRIEWIRRVCACVRENGMSAELPIVNKEGTYISCDREEKRYLVKYTAAGRELDTRNPSEIIEGVQNLADLHNCLTGFTQEDAVCMMDIEQMFDKRMKELRKIYRYVKEKKRKNAFELNFIKEYGYFTELCQKAQEKITSSGMRECSVQAKEQGTVCHGDYNQHNILKDNQQISTVHFENCAVGSQTTDLYSYMRKMLEKSNWSLSLGDAMMHAYLERKPLSAAELEQLYIQFEFSEKFWKIANHYYNSKKTWIPDRSLQKLDKLVVQAPKHRAFLTHFREMYLRE